MITALLNDGKCYARIGHGMRTEKWQGGHHIFSSRASSDLYHDEIHTRSTYTVHDLRNPTRLGTTKTVRTMGPLLPSLGWCSPVALVPDIHGDVAYTMKPVDLHQHIVSEDMGIPRTCVCLLVFRSNRPDKFRDVCSSGSFLGRFKRQGPVPNS